MWATTVQKGHTEASAPRRFLHKCLTLTSDRDIVHGLFVKTVTRIRHCEALTQDLNERLARAYVFAQLDAPGRTLFQKAEKALLDAQAAFSALAEYEEVRR